MFFECIFLYVFCFYRVEFVGFVMKLETLRLQVGSKNPTLPFLASYDLEGLI